VTEAKIGRWGQGIAWNSSSSTLLVQSAADNTIEVFAFDGRTLKAGTPIKLGSAPTGIRTAERRPAARSSSTSGTSPQAPASAVTR
jgi:hypothetical protein